MTEPTITSGRLTFVIGGSETGGSMITAANSTGSSGAGRTSLPCRAIVRQVDRVRGEAYALTPKLGQTPAATLCQSPYAIQNNLLPVAANAATSLAAHPLW
ncbi:hypothetical protein AJ87_49595 [Rhizobium yanglingense]|nr:hypothetical protein AJ87_49595 [Rhizobium yanglingense]